MVNVEGSKLDKTVDKLLKVKEGSPLDKKLDAREAKILSAKKKKKPTILGKY